MQKQQHDEHDEHDHDHDHDAADDGEQFDADAAAIVDALARHGEFWNFRPPLREKFRRARK